MPLQLGAATVAFPRAAAAAFWGWFLSGGVLIASYVIEGGPGGSDPDGVLLWTVGLGGVLVSLCLGTVCVVTTVWALRTAGMGLDRVPRLRRGRCSSPASCGCCRCPVLARRRRAPLPRGPVRRRRSTPTRCCAGPTQPPAVFAYALPALGFVLDVVPVAAGVRQRNRGVLIGAVAAVGILAFGADLLMLGRDASITEDVLYVGAAFALVLPLLVVARRRRPTRCGGAAST